MDLNPCVKEAKRIGGEKNVQRDETIRLITQKLRTVPANATDAETAVVIWGRSATSFSSSPEQPFCHFQ